MGESWDAAEQFLQNLFAGERFCGACRLGCNLPELAFGAVLGIYKSPVTVAVRAALHILSNSESSGYEATGDLLFSVLSSVSSCVWVSAFHRGAPVEQEN